MIYNIYYMSCLLIRYYLYVSPNGKEEISIHAENHHSIITIVIIK